jgi:alpha-methylacyl-CoA racemase
MPSPPPHSSAQRDRTTYPSLTSFFTVGFLSKTRDEWTRLFLGTEACVTPVLEKHEVDAQGVGPFEGERSLTTQKEKARDGGIPMPAPRLSRTPAGVESFQTFSLLQAGADTLAVLREAGVEKGAVKRLLKKGVVGTSSLKAKL